MREFTPRWFHTPHALAAILSLLLCSTAYADSSDGGPPAVWAQKEFQFTYLGFTTKYSCDGLDGKMRTILLELGARKQDLKISDWGCAARTGRPDPFPGVAVKMSVLVPADSAGAPAGAQTLPSQWKALKLQLDSPSRSSLSEAGECELVEQVKEKVLPLFTTRNTDFRDNCVPHQLSPGGTLLTTEVLAPDQTQPSTAAGK